VLRAVLNGEADAGAVGSPFWAGVLSGQLVPAGAVESIWSSPHYHHCMFTARVGLPSEETTRFTDALYRMNGQTHLRPILDAEGLKEWVPPHTEGYGSLREAAFRQGFLARSG
jgi:ABC-type phosphate/phosphonate transport system substrate-binding protein